MTAGDAIAAEEARWREALAGHYLMGVTRAVCGCKRADLGYHPTAAGARRAWIDHVAAHVRDARERAAGDHAGAQGEPGRRADEKDGRHE